MDNFDTNVVFIFCVFFLLGSFVFIALIYIIIGIGKALPKEIKSASNKIKSDYQKTKQVKLEKEKNLKAQIVTEKEPIFEIQETKNIEEDIYFPDPDNLFTDKPPFIRSQMLENFASQVNSKFVQDFDQIVDRLVEENHDMDNISATLYALNLIKEKTAPYKSVAKKLVQPYISTLSTAQELEANGDTKAAIYLYEKLSDAGFTASLPHERLRILYTRQKEYQKAIHACKKYIEILEMVKIYNSRYSNLSLIAHYQEHIKKISTKMIST